MQKMKMQNQKKGFTLVELLVAISIMGVITLIAIPTIKMIIDNKNRGIYEKYGETLVSSTKLYADSYEMDLFGYQPSGCMEVEYQKLKEKNLIKDVQIKNSTCDNASTYVIVKKFSGRYQYQFQLICTDSRDGKEDKMLYEHKVVSPICTAESAARGPEIIVDEPDGWETNTNAYVNVKIKDLDGLQQNNEVIYKWTRDEAGLDVVVEKTLKFNNDLDDKNTTKKISRPPADGKYYLIVQPKTVVDVFGNHTSTIIKKGVYKFDSHDPDCNTAFTLLSASAQSDTWVNKDIDFTFEFVNNELEVANYKWITYKDEVKHSTSDNEPVSPTVKTLSADGIRTYEIKLYDAAGNSSTCKANKNYKIDQEKPTCRILPDDDDAWHTENVELTLKPEDEVSGIAGKKITTSETPAYDGTTNKATQTSDSKGKVWYGYVKDKAGNVGKCSTSVKVDKTPPVCEIKVAEGTTGDNGWYLSNVSLVMEATDDISGVSSKIDLTKSSTRTFAGTTTGTQSADTTGQKWYGYVKDKAGNIGECTKTIKKDTTKPSCTVSGSGTEGDNSWYVSNVSISMSKNDTVSGVVTHGLTTSDSITYNGNETGSQTSDTKGQKWYGYVKDAAGNTNKCEKNVKKDTVDPVCEVKVSSGTTGDNGWYISNVGLSLGTSDATSGVSSKVDLTKSSTVSYGGTTTGTQSADTTGQKWYGYVKDKAGNVSSCSKTIKKDTTVPSCEVSSSGTKGDNNWFVSNVSMSMSKSDTVSGVVTYGLSTSSSVTYNGETTGTQSADTSGKVWNGYIKDAAGNTNKCSKNVKKDETKPNCEVVVSSGTTGDNGWYISDIGLKLNQSDATSGVAVKGLSTTANPTNNKTTGTQTADTSNQTWYGYVKDNAGNVKTCSKNVKKDTTVPSCTVGSSGTKGDNNWFTSDVSITLSDDDPTSGVVAKGLTTSSSATYNGVTTGSQSDDTKGVTWNGYVKDSAGNVGTCDKNVKKDTVKPTCSVNVSSGTTGDNGWYISNVGLTLATSDATSGVSSKVDLTKSSTASYGGTTTGTQTTDTSGQMWYGYVKDNAGNTNNCSKTIKKDTTVPSCSVGATGTEGDNNWYVSNVSITLSDDDPTSGVVAKGLTTSSTASYSGTTTETQSADTKGITWNGYVKDSAGNQGTCSKSVKKDTVDPSCSVNISSGDAGDNGWYRSNVGLSLDTSDATSGVSSKVDLTKSSTISYGGTTTGTQSADTTGQTWYGYVKDKAGNAGNCSKTIKKDTTKPSCTVGASGTKGDNDWYTSNVSMSLSPSDSGGSGVVAKGLATSANSTNGLTSGTQSSDTKNQTWYGYVRDSAGNTDSCTKDVKKDGTKPNCEVVVSSGTTGDNGWYISNVSLTLNQSDPTSGVAVKGLAKTAKSTNGSTTATQSADTSAQVWYGYVKDNAGNEQECSKTIKKDTTTPTCEVIVNSGTLGNNNWYVSNVGLTLNYTDATGVVVTKGLATSSGSTSGNTTGTQSSDTTSQTWYGYVKDNAGNAGNCNNSVKKDSTKPNCEVVISSGTTGDNGWYRSNVGLTLNQSDETSKVDVKGLATTAKSTNGLTSGTQSVDTNNQTWYGYVKDKAGNEQECTKAVKKDTSVPSCTVGASGTKGDNDWYIGNVSMSLSPQDTGSGVVTKGLATSANSTNGLTSGTQSSDTKSQTWYGYVKDAAGNTNSCNKAVKKDSTAPTCTINANGTTGDNGWFIDNVSLSLSASDVTSDVSSKIDLTKSSTASYNGTTTGTQSANTSSQTWYGYVKDKAGNAGSCTKAVKKDASAPSCSVGSSGTVGDNSWYTSNVSMSLSPTDTGGSGVVTKGLATSSGSTNGLTSGTQSNDTKSQTWHGYVKDAAGNSGNCSKAVKKDNTKPTCVVNATGTTGDNGWFKSNIAISLTNSDATSDVAVKGLATTANPTNGLTSGTQSADTTSQTWYGYVKDKAGNVQTCSKAVKKDATKPTLTLANSSSGNWTNKDVILTANHSDSSGITKLEYSYDQSSWTNWAIDTTTKTEGTWSAERNNTVYVRAIDAAGNASAIKSTTVKIDKSAPTVKMVAYVRQKDSPNGNAGSAVLTVTANKDGNTKTLQPDRWFNASTGGVNLEMTISDSASGINSGTWKYDSSGNSSFKDSTELPNSSTRAVTDGADSTYLSSGGYRHGTYTIKDNAGNTSTIYVRVKLDMAAPTLSLANNSGGDWTNKDVILTATHKDVRSGVNKLEYSYDKSSWTNWSIDSATETKGTWEANRNATVYVRATDAAGNKSDIKSTTVKIDKTKPTLGSRIESKKSGEKQDRRFGYYFNDSGGSGFDKSKTYYEYCYTGHTSSGCGATCSDGNAYSHKPAKLDSSDKKYYQEGQFDFVTGNTNGSTQIKLVGGAQSGCLGSYKIRAYFKVCDRAGNCLTDGVRIYTWD